MTLNNLLMSCLIVLASTTAYSMERDNQSPDNLGIPLEELTLDTENPAPTAPIAIPGGQPQTPRGVQISIPRTPLQDITRSGSTSRSGSRAGTPVRTIMPIRGDTPLAATPPEEMPQPTPPVTTVPLRDTPNTALTEAANQAAAAVDRGEITGAEAFERIRAFLPPRRTQSENRNPSRGSRTPDNPN